MSNLNMINNENMISAGSSNNLSGLPSSGPSVALHDSNDNRMMELRVAEQSLDFSNRNFSREVYIYHKKQERFKKTVMGVHTIVSKKLYRLSDLTLEEYFRSRWKISRAQVYRFLDAAEVLKQLSDFTFLPSHELLCRTLKQHAKSQEHMKILWENVLNKVNDHLTSINSSLISSTWLELVKDGKVVPLPPQPKKAKKRIRKSESTESEDASTIKCIKTKHPNLNKDENKLYYNLLEYNEHQINSNIKTNNMGKRSGSFGRYNDESSNQRNYYEDGNMNPPYGRLNPEYGHLPSARSPHPHSNSHSNPSSPVDNSYMDRYRNNYSSYEMNNHERRNEMGRPDHFRKMPLPGNNFPPPPSINDRYYDNYYRSDNRNSNSEYFKYEERDRPNSSYYYERRPHSPGIAGRRSSNFSEINRDYNMDIRNRDANPDEKFPPYMPNPNDRYYRDDYYNNRNNNDEEHYRYRNNPGEKVNGNVFNKHLDRPLSPVSRNNYPPLHDSTVPRPPNYYDEYHDDPKKYKNYYYSPSHPKNTPYEQDQGKDSKKYNSSSGTASSPHLPNEPRTLNDKTTETTPLPSNSNVLTSSSIPTEAIDRDYRSNNPPIKGDYPPYLPPAPARNDERYYGTGSNNPRDSKGLKGNNQNPIVKPVPDTMNPPHSYLSDPRYTSRNDELPPKDINSPKYLSSHSHTSPQNNQTIIPESNSRHYYSQPPPPPLSQRSPVPSSTQQNYSPSTNPTADLNRFSLYKMPPQPNSPSLPHISELNNNKDPKDQKYNGNSSSSSYTTHPNIDRNENKSDNSKSYTNYRRESPVINGPSNSVRRPNNTDFDEYYSRRTPNSSGPGHNLSRVNESIYPDHERDIKREHDNTPSQFSRPDSAGGHQSPYLKNGSDPINPLEDNRPLPPLPPSHPNHDLPAANSDRGTIPSNGINPDFYNNKMKTSSINGSGNNNTSSSGRYYHSFK